MRALCLVIAAAALPLTFAVPASAQNEAPAQPAQLHDDSGAPPQQGLITCWYDANGAFKGSDGAQPGAQSGGPYQTGTGDYTWSYNIAAPNGQSCPPTKPGG